MKVNLPVNETLIFFPFQKYFIIVDMSYFLYNVDDIIHRHVHEWFEGIHAKFRIKSQPAQLRSRVAISRSLPQNPQFSIIQAHW